MSEILKPYIYWLTSSYTEEILIILYLVYSKTCVKRPLSKRPKIGSQYQL